MKIVAALLHAVAKVTAIAKTGKATLYGWPFSTIHIFLFVKPVLVPCKFLSFDFRWPETRSDPKPRTTFWQNDKLLNMINKIAFSILFLFAFGCQILSAQESPAYY